jgi:diacylglycerol kinase family enzyme
MTLRGVGHDSLASSGAGAPPGNGCDVRAMTRVALIVNPMASAVGEERIAAIVNVLERRADVDVLRTEGPRHAMELAGAAGREADAIVVYSGDGGFNEALNGLAADIPIGFLPGGGANVLSRALGLPRDPVRAAEVVADALAAGRTRRITVGRVNGRRFGFSAGIGLDAELVRRVDQLGRSRDGRRPPDVVFAWSLMRILAEHRGRFDPLVEVDGLGYASFALVANCDPYTYLSSLPLRVAPEARFELGLDLVAPRAVRGGSLPRLLAYALLGRGQTEADDVLYRHDADRIEIRCSTPMPLQVDGEDLGDVREALVEAERGAIAVLSHGPS